VPSLPARPSGEHLRKEAKRLARDRSLHLADAQRDLARDYGFPSWPALMRHVETLRAQRAGDSPLIIAVRAGDLDDVRRLLDAGANPRVGGNGESPLHAAARRGPLAVVETLITAGAVEWQPDAKGRTPLDVARTSRARDRNAIVALLDRTQIADPSFRAAVAAVQRGDVARLAALLDAEPRLLHDRIQDPAAYRASNRCDYFLDPKLFWFIANNPHRIDHLPANIVAVARTMLERGVERADLDAALALVMTSQSAREDGHQRALTELLLDAGATPLPDVILVTAGQRQTEILRLLLARGVPMSPVIAATLGEVDALRTLLGGADHDTVQAAFAAAVLNRQLEATRLALDAGADVDAFLPIHPHSTALHQAADNDDLPMLRLVLAHGARTDILDTMWGGNARDWAEHGDRLAAQALLEEAMRSGASTSNGQMANGRGDRRSTT
jgi:hypothetical protein